MLTPSYGHGSVVEAKNNLNSYQRFNVLDIDNGLLFVVHCLLAGKWSQQINNGSGVVLVGEDSREDGNFI